MKAFGSYALACLGIVAVIAAIASIFAEPAGRQAILASACLALAVQMAAFVVTRRLQPKHFVLGWGLGSALRLGVLVLYALFLARLWPEPLTPALLSLAAFLFVTTVVEPIFLKRS